MPERALNEKSAIGQFECQPLRGWKRRQRALNPRHVLRRGGERVRKHRRGDGRLGALRFDKAAARRSRPQAVNGPSSRDGQQPRLDCPAHLRVLARATPGLEERLLEHLLGVGPHPQHPKGHAHRARAMAPVQRFQSVGVSPSGTGEEF